MTDDFSHLDDVKSETKLSDVVDFCLAIVALIIMLLLFVGVFAGISYLGYRVFVFIFG